MTKKDLRDLKARLRLNLPTDFEVRFREVEIKCGAMGDTGLTVPKDPEKRPYFVIRVDKRLPNVAKWLVICHEYAHALQWRGPVAESLRLEDHDIEWGSAEARVWSEVGG